MADLHLDLQTGVIEVGILISIFLHGVASLQVYIFFRGSRLDSSWLKTLVAVVWGLETFSTVLTCMYLYTLTVTNFGNLEVLSDLPWTVDVFVSTGIATCAIVQCFFAYRVHVISGTWLISVVSWTLSLTKTAVSLAVCVLTIKNGDIITFEAAYPWTIIVLFVLAVAIDALNSGSLCYYIHRMRSQYHGTNTLINRIMTCSIGDTLFIFLFWTLRLIIPPELETGLLTSVCAVLMLILEVSRPDWNIWIGILMFYVKRKPTYTASQLFDKLIIIVKFIQTRYFYPGIILCLSLNARSSLRDTDPFAISNINPRTQTIVHVARTTEVDIEMGGANHSGKLNKSERMKNQISWEEGSTDLPLSN